jgi:hypothetical protein
MSAPPIGSTTALPSNAARISMPMNSSSDSAPAIRSMPAASARTSRTPFTICCAEPKEIGRPGMISWSLPKAMFEPQNEIEPTIAAKTEKIAT